LFRGNINPQNNGIDSRKKKFFAGRVGNNIDIIGASLHDLGNGANLCAAFKYGLQSDKLMVIILTLGKCREVFRTDKYFKVGLYCCFFTVINTINHEQHIVVERPGTADPPGSMVTPKVDHLITLDPFREIGGDPQHDLSRNAMRTLEFTYQNIFRLTLLGRACSVIPSWHPGSHMPV
jgi:hypothetical protein